MDLRLKRYPDAYQAFHVDPSETGKAGEFFAHLVDTSHMVRLSDQQPRLAPGLGIVNLLTLNNVK